MADEETDLDEIDPLEEVKPKGSKLVLFLSVCVGLLLLAFGLAAGYIVGQSTAPAVMVAGVDGGVETAAAGLFGDEVEEEAEEEEVEEETEELADAIFLSLRPEFTVNFSDGAKERYLMAALDVMARNKAVIEEVEKNMPVVRYQVLRVFGRQTNSVMDESGKDQLIADILAAIQEVVKSPEGKVEAVYFTSFVIQ
ncbi:MAG: flagellar basal body-associated FliL family protein [Immundisolibacteraceae bacterium]|nr:flagellar basal body-associated FliL family protein [Immundisolibacteraceae bacterium]